MFPFSFVPESVFHEHEVSSLSKLEGVFAQKAFIYESYLIYRRKYLKRRIVYSNGSPRTIQSCCHSEQKDAHMICGNMNNKPRSSQTAGFRKKTRSKISVSFVKFRYFIISTGDFKVRNCSREVFHVAKYMTT